MSQENLFSLIYENTSDMIFVLEKSGEDYIYLSVNKAYENITKVKRDEVTGKIFGNLLSKEVTGIILSKFNEAVIIKALVRFEIKFELKGKVIHLDVVITPVFDEDAIRLLIIAHDITERKIYEEELLKAKNISEQADMLKSALLSNMSHEVRTPLNGIIGFAQLLKLETEIFDHVEMLEGIINSSNRLLYTLHSIIELSQLESSAAPVYSNTVNIRDTVKEVVDSYRSSAKEKGLELTYKEINENINICIDKYFLSQSLHHILQNAIKFTSKGEIKVWIDEIKNESGSYAVINVTDNGPGIPKEEQCYIFDKFRQGSEGLRRKNEGSGLGLTLARKMIEFIGGEIKLESEPGKGSTFTLKLHSIDKDAIKMNKKNPGDKSSCVNKILVVEDNEQDVKLISLYLKNKFEIVHISNASEAVNELVNNNYAAVLMDINLRQGLSGFDIINMTKSHKINFNTPVIAITGYALKDDKNFLLKNGFNYYLSKPFSGDQLLSVLEQCVNEKPQEKRIAIDGNKVA